MTQILQQTPSGSHKTIPGERIDIQEILEIIAGAASPEERASDVYFESLPEQHDKTHDDREARWVRAVANGNRKQFFQLLEARGVDEGKFYRSLRDVRVKSADHLPLWAQSFIELIHDCAASEEDTTEPDRHTITVDSREAMIRKAFTPFLQSGRRTLETILNDHPVEILPAASEQIIDQLMGRLFNISSQLLMHELQVACMRASADMRTTAPSFAERFASLSGWLDLFRRYPVLARNLTIAFDHWKAYNAELFERLNHDREHLEARFAEGRSLGAISAVHSDAGDTHQKGRTVAILTFESGDKVVYKPRDLRIAAAFMDLTAYLNASGLSLPLHERRMVARDNYLWEEWVERTDCANEQEVEQFYTRMGMNLRLLQLLGGRDFHQENFIAAGAHPVVIDLEGILQARMPNISTVEGDHSPGTWEDTVMPIGILPAFMLGDPGRRGVDISALAPAGIYEAANKTPVINASIPGGQMTQDYLSIQRTGCNPIIDGEPASSINYSEQIVSGYQDMDTHFKKLYDANDLKFASHLRRIASLPARFIYRNTELYGRLILGSTMPASLKDGVRREISLERIWKARLANPDHSLKIFQKEIEDMRGLDIPLFTSNPSHDALVLDRQRDVPGFFDGTEADKLWRRWHGLNEVSVEHETDIIRTALSIHQKKPIQPEKKTSGKRIYRTTDVSWLDWAVQIGEKISHEKINLSDGRVTWMGLNYQPWADGRQLSSLDGSILSGVYGLAVLFADLYHTSGLERFREVALQILQPDKSPENRSLWLSSIERGQTASNAHPPYCGGFYGIGAELYALFRCGQALQETSCFDAAAAMVGRMPMPFILDRSPADLVSGKAGLLTALIKGYNATGATEYKDSARMLADSLMAGRDEQSQFSEPPYPSDTIGLNILPKTQAGIAMALLRAVCMDILSISDDEAVGLKHLIDFDQNDSTGGLITNLEVDANGGEYSDSMKRMDEFLAGVSGEQDAESLLEVMELGITTYQSTGITDYRTTAESAAQQLTARYNRYGSWFPEYLAADRYNLSALTGMSAVAHVLLKLHASDEIESLRLLR